MNPPPPAQCQPYPQTQATTQVLQAQNPNNINGIVIRPKTSQVAANPVADAQMKPINGVPTSLSSLKAVQQQYQNYQAA